MGNNSILFKKAIITDEITQDFEEALKLASKYDCDGVEIRSVWGKSPHLLEHADISRIKELLAQYKLDVCGISSSVYKCDMNNPEEMAETMANLDKCIRLAKSLNTRYIRAFTFWGDGNDDCYAPVIEKLTQLGDIAKENDLVILIENDPAVNVSDAEKISKLFGSFKHTNVKALWDPGNLIYNKELKTPYPDGYELVKDYVAHVHLKDAVRDCQGNAEGVLIGEGLLDIEGQLKRLIDDGYDGYVVLEPHFRIDETMSEDILKLPGGNAFSDGGYVPSELSLARLNELLEKIAS